jgi:prolyl 4-hydroxylase
MDAILRRGADVLNIDEAMFRPRDAADGMNSYTSNKNPINEDLQIVHYDQGQQYTAHHDFGYPDTRPNAPSRSINLCLYLNDEGLVGGQTAFPRARSADSTEGIAATPEKGKAMIFYMKNPDGNLDGLSQHAAMPVLEGEKWFANLWSWDPERI